MKKLSILVIMFTFCSLSVNAATQVGTVDRFVPSTGYKVNTSSLAQKMENATRNATQKNKTVAPKNNTNNGGYNNNTNYNYNYNYNYNQNNTQKPKYTSDWT